MNIDRILIMQFKIWLGIKQHIHHLLALAVTPFMFAAF